MIDELCRKQTSFKGFQAREHVYLSIKPKNNSLRIGSCAKLTPHYYGPFEILQRIRLVAYRISVPPTMKFHDVFHVSLVKICVKVCNHVIDCFVL